VHNIETIKETNRKKIKKDKKQKECGKKGNTEKTSVA
jgi:hypothetical protein